MPPDGSIASPTGWLSMVFAKTLPTPAGVNLAIGAVGIMLAVGKLKERKVLVNTRDELQTTAIAFRSQAP